MAKFDPEKVTQLMVERATGYASRETAAQATKATEKEVAQEEEFSSSSESSDSESSSESSESSSESVKRPSALLASSS